MIPTLQLGGLGRATRSGEVNDWEQLVLSHSPALWWRFDEASGNLVDRSGNARAGTMSGSPTYDQAGLFSNTGKAISFAGTQYASVADFLGASYNSGLTFEAVFSITDVSAERMIAGREGTSPGADWSVLLRNDAGGALSFGVVATSGGSAAVLATTATGVLANATAYHVMGTWTPAVGSKAYLNGALAATGASAKSTLRNGTSMVLTAGRAVGVNGAVKLDEFLIYANATVGDTHAAAHYAALTS
jgi:hypothetical protein